MGALHIHGHSWRLARLASKPLTKVTNSLPIPVIRIKMKSSVDHSAQELASMSVDIPAYAYMLLKKCSIIYGGRTNFVPGIV